MYFSNLFQDVVRHSSIYVNNADCGALGSSFARAAQGEIGDVDLSIAKNGADLADYAGHVVVPHVEEIAAQRHAEVGE